MSFRSVVDAGEHQIGIRVVARLEEVNADVLRAIEVPFEIGDDGAVEVGSIESTVAVAIPPGPYVLRCEFLRRDIADVERARLTFAWEDRPGFKIARADSMLSPGENLLISAVPA